MIWHADLHPDEVDGCVGIDLVSLLVAVLVSRGLSVEGQLLESAGQRGAHTGQADRFFRYLAFSFLHSYPRITYRATALYVRQTRVRGPVGDSVVSGVGRASARISLCVS